ncbi:MAG: ATP-dependent helicase [Verrucomicrobiales bacterium]|nr:ATP-dependent helicase [Verrucomicrobiales bacterium]MCP5558519.1 ATP-dependent helicase [Verrucomicrobiaceae bacterium]
MPREYTLHTSNPERRSAIDYRAELNDQQYEAVTSAPGQALVIAGAGSGKTRTLTYRVAWLLDNGILPENILLLTFTNKAAREMLERVQGLVPVETQQLWGGTFHSIGNRILRHHAEFVGFRKGYSIMDREDQKSLMDTVIASSGIDTSSFHFPKSTVLCEIFSLLTNTLGGLHEVIADRFEHFIRVEDQIEEVWRLYELKKRETNSMDFDDLLALTVALLEENPDVRERFQRQFQFVLVDEFQDTNSLQCKMIDMLVGEDGNLMVVGDDAQSIYSWRGADVQNILQFPEKHHRTHVHKIEVNYRSVPEVLHLANAAIANNSGQIRKALQPARPVGGMLPALVPLDNPGAQAAFVAQRILELRDEGVDFREMAVLYRAHFHSLEIQMELTQRGIPYQITSGLRFFEQAHVKDVAAFMKLIVNRHDEVSFMRIVRMIPGVGNASAGRLWTDWRKSGMLTDEDVPRATLAAALHGLKVPKKATSVWEQFAYTLEELVTEEGKPVPPRSMIQSVTEGVYLDYMKSKFENYEQREQDLEQLADFADNFREPLEFLGQLALLSGVDTDNKPADDGDKDAVTLTTIHQAKGLEWHAVFAVWLADGMFPHSRVIEEGAFGALEEERRLFYVTITRAKDELYMTYPLIWHQARDGNIMQKPSRFVAELPKELFELWKIKAW